MRAAVLTRLRRVAILATAIGTLSGNSFAAQSPDQSPAHKPGTLTVRAGDVRVRCPLTIGGSFEARTKALTGTVHPGAAPGSWDGMFTVDLSGLDTGISLRNQHLRDTYLEVSRQPDFAHAVMTDVRLDNLTAGELTGKGHFSARLLLHGVERPVAGQAEVRRTESGIRVRASFPVVLDAFGIAKPRHLGVGVREEVTVQATFEAMSTATAR